MTETPQSDALPSRPFGEQQLAGYESWLKLLARAQFDSRIQGKFDPSDAVQQTLMEAWRAAPGFRGQTEGERRVWLRRILAGVLAHEFRRYRGAQKRDMTRELSIEQSLAQSSQQLGAMLASVETSPSQQAAQREQELAAAEVLERLPRDYRQVIMLRNLQGLPHEEVARRMDRSPNAVRMLWLRALKRLRKEMGSE